MGLSEIKDLLLPWKTKAFFRRMHPRPLGNNLSYAALLGLFWLAGSFLMYGFTGFGITSSAGEVSVSLVYVYSLPDSALLAMWDYLQVITAPVLFGFSVTLMGKYVAGRHVPLNESVTIATYVYTPWFFYGILQPVFGGLGGMMAGLPPIGVMVMSAFGIYQSYLMFSAVRVSFDKKWSPVLVVIISFLLISAMGWIISSVADTISGNAISSIEPVDIKQTFSSGGNSIGLDRGGFSFRD